METRKEKLANLIHLKGDISILVNELNYYPWDSTESLYILKKENILRVFNLFAEGQINAPILETWANAIECREDIDYEDDILQEVINELANPELYGTLSEDHIDGLRKMIS